jgi:hypothetical protein
METDMPVMASIDNPLGHFRDGAMASADGREWPIPLAATRIDVAIRGGLAIVTTERIFRNAEPRAIEATLTFPVPVDATLCALSARIGGRMLHAVAQPRQTARQTYEDAIDRGHATILHEELLKGVHMLSLGQVGPGAEIAVSTTWTAPLSFIDDTPRLRVPTTVADIYGQSPLSPGDDLVVGDTVHEATIGVVCDRGGATILGAGVGKDGRHAVRLDHPIDIVVDGFAPSLLRGVAADGRAVELTIEPMARATDPLAVDVLFDHSGSMTERSSGNPEVTGTKFEVAKAALLAVVRNQLKSRDSMRLWEFNDSVARLGEATGADIEALVRRLHDPAGGTEIGRAFEALMASARARNVVVITDGLSWALDPRQIARHGLRVTTVLIGENSFEGGVAELAGMTGGQVFVASGSDAAAAIVAAFDAARAPHRPQPAIGGTLSMVEAFRRGGRLVARWDASADGTPSTEARQIGATAAMLAIPMMEAAAAADLAAREGIVCHLTSLVLVDEAGIRHEGVPATRKVALSTPRTFHVGGAIACAAPPTSPALAPPPESASFNRAERARAGATYKPGSHSQTVIGRAARRLIGSFGSRASAPPTTAPVPLPAASRRLFDLSHVLARIDWDEDPDALRCGDLHLLMPDIAALIWQAAGLPAIDALANAADLDPVVAVIAVLAKAAGKTSRSADRLARNLLRKASAGEIARAMEELGLRSLSPTS